MRTLGKTGVQLPILGFGTAHTGLRLNTRDAVRLYETAFRAGVRYFDTAPEFAGYGKAQTQLSHFLKHARSNVFLVTKCYEPDGERALQLLQRSLKEAPLMPTSSLCTAWVQTRWIRRLCSGSMEPMRRC